MAISHKDFLEIAGENLDAVLAEMHLSEAAYERILRIVLDTLDGQMIAFAEKLAVGDREGSRKIAHELKGVFANVRLAPLARAAAFVEQAVQGAGGTVEGWGGYEELSRYAERLKSVLVS